MQLLISLSTWLHTIASLILIGHYLLVSIIYLPVLEKLDEGGKILGAISKRSRLWMYLALALFASTGIHLMLVDPNYQGIGDFGNLRAILILIKHFLVSGMICMGFWFNAILRVGPIMCSNNGAALTIRRFELSSKLMAISGIPAILLTALAQIE